MIRLINIFILAIVFLSCKKQEEKNDMTIQQDTLSKVNVKSQNLVLNDINQEDNSLNINGTWTCYKFLSDDRNEKKYDTDYAQEIARYSKFIIENNKLKINNCTKNIYTYKYSTKLKKFEDESVFITYFKPKKDSVEFIDAINSGNDTSCDILDNYTFYIPDNENIIHYDRGYYFYYKKIKDVKSSNNYTTQGIPANNRNEWAVTGTFVHSKSLEDGYRNFRKEFPYGSKNTTETFPKNEEFIDSKNGIIYNRSNNEYKIMKDDPMGKIIIKISQNKNSPVTFSYEMHYPDY